MASTVQIVPKYQHPHVETYVYDNTFYTEDSTVEVDDTVQFINIFVSGKGIDNKLVKKTSLKSFTDTFGKSNPAKYGQPLMMPIAELNTGIASAWCMRVMPTDAAYANSVLSVYYKADVATKTFTVKFKAKSLTGENKILNRSDIVTNGAVLDAADGLDGFTHLPIATFIAMGRGEYGQNYRWRITSNKDYEKDYEKKFFTFEVLSTESGLSKEATYVGMAVVPDDLREAVFINDIVDNYEEGSYPASIHVFDENVESLYDAYATFLTDVAKANPDLTITVPARDEFDLFFGTEVKSTTAYEYYKITTSEEDSTCVDVDASAGIAFAGGDEGSFGSDDANAVAQAIDEAYKNAFLGVTDKMILSPRRVPCSVLLDANYSLEVKKALVQLAQARNDCLCYIDCGIVSSLSAPVLKSLNENYSGIFADRGISKEIQHYVTRDIHTKRRTTVTMTYYLAQNLPQHYMENGKYVPFVKSYAELSDHIRNSLAPVVEMFESDLKEQLYTNRFNYFEAIGENRFQRACQCTAQVGNSDLLEENNVQTLFDVKRQLELDCWENTYNFTSADERARFKQTEEAQFASWKGSRFDTISINFDCNEWEAERSIIHCYAALQFRNMTKRSIIEIDVNKRNFTA